MQKAFARCKTQHVKLFWNKLEGFICDHCNNVQNLKFNEKIILFGTDDNFKSDSVLDFTCCVLLRLTESHYQLMLSDNYVKYRCFRLWFQRTTPARCVACVEIMTV